MKIFLMLLLIQTFPDQVIVDELYNAKTLPRDQWYEVGHIDNGSSKDCINQYLAPNFQNSYWRIVKKEKSEDCREDGGEVLITKKKSEIFKFQKNAQGVELTLTQDQRETWNWSLWNFKKKSFLKMGKLTTIEPIIEDGLICEHYNVRCEPLIQKKCQACINGHVPVIGSGCSQHTRICGTDCGGRDQVACSQGLVSDGNTLNLVCPHQKRGAICNKGLTAYCFNNIVYCK